MLLSVHVFSGSLLKRAQDPGRTDLQGCSWMNSNCASRGMRGTHHSSPLFPLCRYEKQSLLQRINLALDQKGVASGAVRRWKSSIQAGTGTLGVVCPSCSPERWCLALGEASTGQLSFAGDLRAQPGPWHQRPQC